MAVKPHIKWKCIPDVAALENTGVIVSLRIKGDARFYDLQYCY